MIGSTEVAFGVDEQRCSVPDSGMPTSAPGEHAVRSPTCSLP